VKKIICIILFLSSILTYAADSTRIDTSYHHNRKKAAILSMVVPGLGSFYNEYGHRKVQGRAHVSWWRAPIYWAGLGFTGYFAYKNGIQASRLKKEWLFRQDNPDQFWHYEYEKLSDDELINSTKKNDNFNGFNNSSKYRDYLIAGFALVYVLNITDAYVDAHFVSFDVSQNLTLSFQPKMYSPKNYGVGLTLNFN